MKLKPTVKPVPTDASGHRMRAFSVLVRPAFEMRFDPGARELPVAEELCAEERCDVMQVAYGPGLVLDLAVDSTGQVYVGDPRLDDERAAAIRHVELLRRDLEDVRRQLSAVMHRASVFRGYVSAWLHGNAKQRNRARRALRGMLGR